jgi:hypothetical protein
MQRKRLLGIAIVLVGLGLGIPRRACASPASDDVLQRIPASYLAEGGAVGAFAAADLIFGGYDVAMAFRGRRTSTTMAVGEVVLGAPQAVYGFYLVSNYATDGRNGGYVGPTLALAAVPTFMLAHGLWRLVAEGPPEDIGPAPHLGSSGWSLLPTLVSDGKARGPGLGVCATF